MLPNAKIHTTLQPTHKQTELSQEFNKTYPRICCLAHGYGNWPTAWASVAHQVRQEAFRHTPTDNEKNLFNQEQHLLINALIYAFKSFSSRGA